jgi:hypothetical protein
MEAIEVYEAFIAFLERDLELQGPWPREMERGLGGGRRFKHDTVSPKP